MADPAGIRPAGDEPFRAHMAAAEAARRLARSWDGLADGTLAGAAGQMNALTLIVGHLAGDTALPGLLLQAAINLLSTLDAPRMDLSDAACSG